MTKRKTPKPLPSDTDLLARALDDAATVAREAVAAYPRQAQAMMVVEECAELTLAVARIQRGRATGAGIVEECADVIITALSAALIFGMSDYAALAEALRLKIDRLRERVRTKP